MIVNYLPAILFLALKKLCVVWAGILFHSYCSIFFSFLADVGALGDLIAVT